MRSPTLEKGRGTEVRPGLKKHHQTVLSPCHHTGVQVGRGWWLRPLKIFEVYHSISVYISSHTHHQVECGNDVCLKLNLCWCSFGWYCSFSTSVKKTSIYAFLPSKDRQCSRLPKAATKATCTLRPCAYLPETSPRVGSLALDRILDMTIMTCCNHMGFCMWR